MTKPIVKTATASDEAPVIDVLALAFSADPASRWTWPDPLGNVAPHLSNAP